MQMKAPIQAADFFFFFFPPVDFRVLSALTAPNPKPILQLTYLPFS